MRVTVKMIEFGTTIANQTGGSYNGTLITYVNNGKTLTKGIATKFIDSPQQAELKAKLEKLSKEVPKDVVFITTETESNGRKFTNFVDVLEAGAEDTSVRYSNSTAHNDGTRRRSAAGPLPTFGNGSGGSNYLKDVTIARSVGVKAAVDSGVSDIGQILHAATEIANYIVQPLGVDANGNKLTVNEVTDDTGNTNF